MENLYTLKEAHVYLKISDSTIRRLIKAGELPARKIGNQYRIAEIDIKHYLDENKTTSDSDC